jgi:hypothetical protein
LHSLLISDFFAFAFSRLFFSRHTIARASGVCGSLPMTMSAPMYDSSATRRSGGVCEVVLVQRRLFIRG